VSTDIVERIRGLRYVHVPVASALFEEAANEIERLRAENARLRGLCGLSQKQSIPEIES
jgi:cell shape-determining protein MreC